MKLALGIDTGGTCTDAVLVDQASGDVQRLRALIRPHENGNGVRPHLPDGVRDFDGVEQAVAFAQAMLAPDVETRARRAGSPRGRGADGDAGDAPGSPGANLAQEGCRGVSRHGAGVHRGRPAEPERMMKERCR